MKKPDLKVVTGELPDPPYPADTWTKGWRFELDMQRIRRSDTWVLCPVGQRPWLLMMWATAWEQVPAGSLPDSHELISAHIGMNLREFSANHDILLRGFRLHSDGLLYHPVVCEQVIALLGYRDAERERKAKYRNMMKNKKSSPMGQTRDGHGSPMGETLQEQEQEQDKEEEKKKYKKEKQKKAEAPSAARFAKPTVLEVQNYCSEKGYTFDAESFVAFYESKGWLVGKAPMKSWKAACTTWSKQDRSNSTGEYNGKRYKNSTDIMFENIRKLDERRERERKAFDLHQEHAEKNVSELWSDILK